MKKSLLLVLLMLPMLNMLAQDELYYGTYTGTGTQVNNGTQKAEAYDVAMHVTDPALVGLSVVGMRIPVVTDADASGYKAWLSTKLELDEDKNVVADIASVEFSPKAKWVEVTFDEPYVIPAEGLYAGYSLTVNAVTSSTTDPSKKPLVCIAADDASNFFIHTLRTYRKWQSYGESALAAVGVPAMVLRLVGEGVHAYAANFKAPDELSTNVFVDQQATITFPLVNHGTANITNIDYELTVGEETLTAQARVTLRGPYYGRTADVKVPMPVLDKKGAYDSSIRVLKVNGQDNLDPNPSTRFTMVYVAEPPKHKPLMEEYTGTWCQWCPSGMVAMENLNELYGDDFVGLAYHEGDSMEVTSNFPNEVSGFPNAYLDRIENVSPFFGTSGQSFGIKDDIEACLARKVEADIDVTATWASDDKKTVKVQTTTTFYLDLDTAPYALGYILISDSLKGTGTQWAQQNNYAIFTQSAGDDPNLLELTKKKSIIAGMKFNHVAILGKGIQSGLTNSVKAPIVDGEPQTHTYSLTLPTSTNLVQDKENLRVVAFLIDKADGSILNARETRIGAPVGIADVQSEGNNQVVGYYNMQGQRLQRPQSGVVIIRYADGHADKVLLR